MPDDDLRDFKILEAALLFKKEELIGTSSLLHPIFFTQREFQAKQQNANTCLL